MKKYALGLFTIVWVASCDVNAPPGNYDLEATSITVEPKEIFVGDGVVFSYVVTNKGTDTIPAGSYEVDLYFEQDSIAFDHDTPMLDAGKNVEYGMTDGMHHWKAAAPGTYKYRLVVDEQDRLDETDEENNQVSGVITVKRR